MRVAISKHGAKEIRANNFSLMCGFATGEKTQNGANLSHMMNWFYFVDGNESTFFQGQDGTFNGGLTDAL